MRAATEEELVAAIAITELGIQVSTGSVGEEALLSIANRRATVDALWEMLNMMRGFDRIAMGA